MLTHWCSWYLQGDRLPDPSRYSPRSPRDNPRDNPRDILPQTDDALNTQTQANNDNASYDARRFGCAPWHASRGIAFRRFNLNSFKRAFTIYLASLEIRDPDDEFSYDDELLGRSAKPTATPPREAQKRTPRLLSSRLQPVTTLQIPPKPRPTYLPTLTPQTVGNG